MKAIKSVEINNFRSIVKLNVGALNRLNIIVGKNDIGKSNFLKALNLFFNDETELGNKFSFKRDFSRYAIVKQKKAKEISIKLTFYNKYDLKNDIVWHKTWRSDGKREDSIKMPDGSQFSPKGGAMQWVKRIKYKYIPAIKGTEYFTYLMGEMHDALSTISAQEFQTASNSFIDGLGNVMSGLINEMNSLYDANLHYTNTISMPSDFKSLFSTLNFSLNQNGTLVPLDTRGDGIKAQHIPVILKFIAAHYRSIAGRGMIPTDTIWGFEEPENNMELANAFKFADLFYSYSKDLQIFINTHSPAFYQLGKQYNHVVLLYAFSQSSTEPQTLIENKPITTIESIDEQMGLLPFITDYIKEEISKKQIVLAELAEARNKLRSYTLPTIITEGKSDELILKTAWKTLYNNKSQPFAVVSIDNRTDNTGGTGGCISITKLLETVRPDGKLHIAIYDQDNAGKKAFNSLSANFITTEVLGVTVKVHQNKKAIAFLLPTFDDRTAQYAMAENLSIEYYFDDECIHLKNNGIGLHFMQGTLQTRINGKITNECLNENPYYFSIDGGKMCFAESIVPMLETSKFEGFRHLFELIDKIILLYSS